jgi:hypothetical protein
MKPKFLSDQRKENFEKTVKKYGKKVSVLPKESEVKENDDSTPAQKPNRFRYGLKI